MEKNYMEYEEMVDLDLNFDYRTGKMYNSYQECKSIRRKDSIRLPGYVNVKKDGFVVPQPGFVTVMNHFYGEDNWIPVSGIKFLPDMNKRAWMFETREYAEAEFGDRFIDPIDLEYEVSDEDYKTLVDKIVCANKDSEFAIYAKDNTPDGEFLRFYGVYKLDSIESILQHRLILHFKSYKDDF